MMPETAAESSERVLRDVGRAMGTFSMLETGDRVLVGVSGGKDSMCLVHALEALRRRAPFPYRIVAVTVEQGKFTADIREIGRSLESIGVEWILRSEPRTLDLVEAGVEHGCDVCSRNRRGALYRIAEEVGATVLALGHTADDAAESLLRNVLFNGRIASLPPVAESRQGGLRVIRPLVFVNEEWTGRYAADHGLDLVGCVCREKAGPRSEIREFLEKMETRYPGSSRSLNAALGNVNPYTLADPDLRKRNADIPVFGRDPVSPTAPES